MRKITKEACEVFKAEVNAELCTTKKQRFDYNFEKEGTFDVVYSKDNTKVINEWRGRFKIVCLKLHGNTIAHHKQNMFASERSCIKFYINLCGWGTPTTRERLNGLLETLGFDFSVKQKKGEQIACGRKYGSNINRSYRLDEDGNQDVFFINEIITGGNI
tara:strand:+ start:1274 stop:1753 length:480 start_codon:yes stop_codon:yes gene_type:complete